MTTTESSVAGVETRGAAGYVWQAPGKALAVHLSLDVVERMERQVIQSFKAITQRGSEIGGLLLGRMPANPALVTVEDYLEVECDYARGPLYLLAEADKARLAAAIRRAKEDSEKGLSVVGFFRSNTRRDLAMDEDDLALMSEYFSEPRQVCLLIKPFSMKPSVAGFFIWEMGKIQGQSSYLQFPFRRSELAKGEGAAAAAAAGRAPGGGNGAGAAKPEARAASAAAPASKDEAPATPAAAPRGEVRVSIPLAIPRREEPPPSPAKLEPRAPVTPPSPKRETPAPPPPPPPVAAKPEARASAPAFLPRREAPAQAPITAKPEMRVATPPVVPRREPPVPPPAPKTEARAAVTPVPPRREEAVPAPSEARAVTPAAAPKPEHTPAPPSKPPARTSFTSLGLARHETSPGAPPATKPEAGPTASAASKPEPPASEAPAPKREGAPAPSEGKTEESVETIPATRPQRVKLPYAIAAVVALFLIAASGMMYFRPGAGRTPPPAGPDAASLALRVERNAGQLLLSWNREATAVKAAQAAVLSILDGDHKEDVKLELNQLRSGSIVYSPITNDVSFKLEVTDARGQTANETVRVIAGRPSPAAPLGQTPPPKPEAAAFDGRTRQETPAAQASPSATETALQPSPTPGGGAEPSAPAKQAPVQFRAESLAARLSPAPSLPEPPRLEAQGAAAPVRPAYGLNVPAPPPVQVPKPAAQESSAPPSPQGETTQAPAPGQPLRVGGNVQQALLVRSVTPNYPPLARQARVSGVVRVEATIGRDGRIVRVQAISGPPLLRQAATDAVRQWLYKPTMLNGQPVEVVTQVDVTFNLNR